MDLQFEKLVQHVLSFIEKRMDNTIKPNTVLRANNTPETIKQKIPISLDKFGNSPEELINIINTIIENSLITNHPYFMNQMFGKTQAISFIADILISALNTSMYTFEVAPVFSLIEKEVITKLGEKIWGKGMGDGVFTAGGSMSNMNALFLAREHLLTQAKQKGLFQEKPLAVFVSEQAHYSFTKGVNFLGFGRDALIKIPSNSKAQINTDALKKVIDKTKKEGKRPLMLIGIAGTTISGSFDDLTTLAQIAKKHAMWFHVDAAFGGSLLFSEQHKSKLKGIEYADSVTWNFHKVMGMNLSTASFLTKEKGILNKAFNVNAGYLFHETDYDFDLGQKSLQGGRRPDAFKLWLSWKYQGENGLSKHVNSLCNAAQTMATMIDNKPDLELFSKPESSIVCFRYTGELNDSNTLDDLNIRIRNHIFTKGELLFNYAVLNNKTYLRCVLLDPKFTDSQLQFILDEIKATGKTLVSRH